ncbi:MAG: nitroreductase family protein [Methanoregula sp.]|jgi:hypothetical protein
MAAPAYPLNQTIPSPQPDFSAGKTLDPVLENQRSVREYKDTPLPLARVSQILWAGQGIPDPATGKRTAPSA